MGVVVVHVRGGADLGVALRRRGDRLLRRRRYCRCWMCIAMGCHSGGSPSAGLDLKTTPVAQSVLEGSLLERLQLPPSDIRMMPLNGNPLPECDIALFQSWAANGAPNN